MFCFKFLIFHIGMQSCVVYVWCMCGVCVVYVWCMCGVCVFQILLLHLLLSLRTPPFSSGSITEINRQVSFFTILANLLLCLLFKLLFSLECVSVSSVLM